MVCAQIDIPNLGTDSADIIPDVLGADAAAVVLLVGFGFIIMKLIRG